MARVYSLANSRVSKGFFIDFSRFFKGFYMEVSRVFKGFSIPAQRTSLAGNSKIPTYEVGYIEILYDNLKQDVNLHLYFDITT